MSTPALEVEGLRYAYGDVVAVDDVSFTVAPGEVLGVLGPNGAGKSTTIKMLTGQLRPAAGHIRVLDLDVAAEPDRVQARIGVCFEEKNLYPSLSGRENLRFFARLFGPTVSPDLDLLLARVGLAERADDRVASYSKGMRQRLMVARALVNAPEVLFLDEPTAGLDPVSARAVRAIVREESTRGVAIVLTTHDMYEADELSDRVAFLDRGRVLAIDAPEELKLAHGTRTVRVTSRGPDGQLADEVLPLGDSAGPRLAELLESPDVLTVHTEEATLEDVFVAFAGRGLT